MSPSQLDTLYVRAFTEKPGRLPIGARPDRKSPKVPSGRVLVFDCETTTDESQKLRFGWCQQWDGDTFLGAGLVYPEYTSDPDLALLTVAAKEIGATLLTLDEFRLDVILGWAFEGNATLVGFNLAFDIARVALQSSPARGHMRGGFTHRLAQDEYAPCIRTKHLSATMTLMDFARPRKNETPRSMRNAWDEENGNTEDVFVPARRGFFVDVKTLAMAQLSRKHSLDSLAASLKTATQKMKVERHGGPLTAEYIRYGFTDVQVTWECYRKLVDMYAQHQLERGPHQILSEASVGKAYLEAMKVQPFFAFQNSEPRANLGRNMSTYYGGRAESGIRRKVTQVMYCDFKSMYPTVNGLMGSTRFVTAQGYTEQDTTEATQAFLDAVTVEDLLKPETWRKLPTIVQLRPNDDLLPARMRYTPDHKDRKKKADSFTIGLNHIRSDLPLWFMMPDVIASMMLTGKAPRIERAITFVPGPQQEGLQPIRLFGREEYTIDPRKDDIFIRLIDMRDEAKANRDPLERVMKIIANATCYGIYAEVQRDDAPKPESINVHGPHGEGGTIQSQAIEEPGEYFHPVLAPLITSAARLMLALAERLARDEGLAWTFCDTDSIAMTKPDRMTDAEFYERCNRVVDRFKTLNPYRLAGSILKAEDHNFEHGSKPQDGKLRPLYCLSISAKRYALFNLDNDGRPVIRKFSAHGLGHLMEPYSDAEPALNVAAPVSDVHELGGKRWQYDRWYHLIQAALAGTPDKFPRDYHPALSQPAMLRYGATSPAMLRWMKAFNANKAYDDQVKPYGFMVGFLPRVGGAFAEDWHAELVEEVRAGRPHAEKRVHPIAPFDRDPAKAVEKAFDRDTGRPIDQSELRTYAEALALYHVSPEEKFENGGPADVGPTVRRHLLITRIGLIGKEANKVGEAGDEDGESEAVAEFGNLA